VKSDLIIVLALVCLAAWLRLSHLDQIEFLWDQSEISKWALQLAREGRFSWVGPISSTGLDTFPVAIWLWAIPYAFSTSPVFASGFLVVLHLLALLSYYVLVRRWFGRTAALVTTLLFAVAPWAVIYSRKIWHTTLLPPLILPYIATGWLTFVRRRHWVFVAHILSLVCLVQTHFSTLPFVLLTGLWMVIFWRRVDWRLVPLAMVVALLTFVPYLAVDAQKGWPNVHRLLEIMRRPTVVSGEALYATWAATTGQGLSWLTGPDRAAEFIAATPNLRWLFVVEGGLAVAGSLLALVQAIRKARVGLDDETATALVVATWLLVPALFFIQHKTIVAPHYFTITFPAQFILVGWLVSWLVGWLVDRLAGWLRRGTVVRVALIMLVMAIAAAQTYETIAILRFVATHDTRWGYGTPVHYEIEAVQTALRLGEELGSREVILLSEGDEPRMYEMPNAVEVLLYRYPHRAVDVRSTLVFPQASAIYWVACDPTPAEELLASLAPEQTWARISLREGLRSFRFYHWPGGEPQIPGVRPLPDGPRLWANGAQLIGYRVEGDIRPGGRLHWMLVWRATRTPSEDVYYHWFNHLLDEQGQMCAQQDGPSLIPSHWRAGDTILNWFSLDIPAEASSGPYTMRVGMYAMRPGDWAFLGNVQVMDAGGGLAGEWITIGPLRLYE